MKMSRNYYAFRESIGMKESTNNYKSTNKFGFLGKFQMGKARLLDLGISIDRYGKLRHPVHYFKAKKMTKKEFLENKELQDIIFFMHVQDCIKQIKNKNLDKHIGSVINGVKITMSGLVAGMHLGGLGNLTKWFVGIPFKDAFGTDIKNYIFEFADYDLNDF